MDTLNKNIIKIVLRTLILLILIVIVAIVFYKKINKSQMNESESFSLEYVGVPTDNIYVYATQAEILEAFELEKSVIFFGFPECKWCQEYAIHLNEIAKEYGVEEILYYNIKEDREKNTEFYKQIVAKVSDYLFKDENENFKIYVPDVYFVQNGKIVGHNNDTSTISKMEIDEYYTEENTKELQEKLNTLFNEISSCNDEKGC